MGENVGALKSDGYAEPVKALLPIEYQIMHLRDRFRLPNRDYYDYPEGEDLIGKVVYLNRKALWPAAVFGWLEITVATKLIYNPPMAIGRMAYYMGPASGAATAFATTVYGLTRLRQKDDTWNYFIGSLAAGGVIGAWQRSYQLGWAAGLFFSLFAVAKRIGLEEGWNLIPVLGLDREFSGFREHRREDFTLHHERPKNYIAIPAGSENLKTN